MEGKHEVRDITCKARSGIILELVCVFGKLHHQSVLAEQELDRQYYDYFAVLHDRMPVIFHPTEFNLWLERSMDKTEKLQRLYQPSPTELLQELGVSALVNNPSAEIPGTIAPLRVPH
jgi:hypothetical protein